METVLEKGWPVLLDLGLTGIERRSLKFGFKARELWSVVAFHTGISTRMGKNCQSLLVVCTPGTQDSK